MPTLTLRPNQTISNGNWTKVPSGGDLASILADDNDATYIQQANNRCQLKGQVATVGLQDISIPTGAKIFSVGINIRVGNVKPSGGGGGGGHSLEDLIRFVIELVEEVIEDVFFGADYNIFKLIFGFFCPKDPPDAPPTVTWTTQQLAYYTEAPSGGEWTQDTFNAFTVNLGRQDSSSKTGLVSELYAIVTYNERPVCTATGPVGPITDTTRALVTWTYSDPESDRQQAFRVRVFTQAQYSDPSFDVEKSTSFCETSSVVGSGGIRSDAIKVGGISPWILGEDLRWTLTRDTPNGTYRAYVKVQQEWNGLGSHESDWSYIEWTQNVPGPPNPELTAVVDNNLNRVQVDFEPLGPTPPTVTYNVEFSDDAGITWELLRGGLQTPAGATNFHATLFDYEAPLNQARWYRAQGYRQLGTILVASDYSNIAMATPLSNKFWLKDPLDPTKNMVLPVSNDAPRHPRSQGIFAPLVADGYTAFKIPVTGPQYGIEGDLELIFVGHDDVSGWTKFNEIYKPGRTLLFQYPTGEQHYIVLGADLQQEWLLQDRSVRYRRVKTTYIEVAKPEDIT